MPQRILDAAPIVTARHIEVASQEGEHVGMSGKRRVTAGSVIVAESPASIPRAGAPDAGTRSTCAPAASHTVAMRSKG